MASRIEIEKKQKKISIINSSRNIFLEKGFENTKVDDIANSSGVAKGTVYTYFRSKEEILEEILIDLIKKLKMNFVQQAFSTEEDLCNGVELVTLNFVEKHEDSRLFEYFPKLNKYKSISRG